MADRFSKGKAKDIKEPSEQAPDSSTSGGEALRKGRKSIETGQQQEEERLTRGKPLDKELVQRIRHSLDHIDILSGNSSESISQGKITAEQHSLHITKFAADIPSSGRDERMENYDGILKKLRGQYSELSKHMLGETAERYENQYDSLEERCQEARSRALKKNFLRLKKTEAGAEHRTQGEKDLQKCINEFEEMINKMTRKREFNERIRQQAEELKPDEIRVIKGILDGLNDKGKGLGKESFNPIRLDWYSKIKTVLELPPDQRELAFQDLANHAKDVLQGEDILQWRIAKERLMKEYLPNNEKDKEVVESWTTSEELWAASESWTTTIEESTQKVQDQLRSGQGKGDNREMAEEEIRRKEASPESIKTKEEKTAEREAEKRRKNAERMEIVNEWAKGLESTPNPSLEYKLHPPSSHEDSDRLYDEDSYLPDSQRPPSTLKDSDSPSGTASRDSGGSNEEARSDIATDGSEGIVNPQAKGREDRFINLYDETPMQKKGNAEYDRDIYKKDPNDLLGGDRVNKFLDKRESFEVMKYRIQSMSVRDARPIYEAWINKNILKESKWRKIEIDAMNEYFNHRLDEVIHNMLFGIEKISEENDISEEKLRKTYETCINTYTTEASPERPRLIEGMNRYFTGRGLIEGMKKHLTDGENRELINLKFRIIKMSKEEAGPICETFINAHTTEGSTERAGLIEEMNKYL